MLRCICLHSPRPNIELLARWFAKEYSDVGEGHARFSQRVDQLGLAQLTRGVVPVTRYRINRHRDKESTGCVAPEALR